MTHIELTLDMVDAAIARDDNAETNQRPQQQEQSNASNTCEALYS